MATNCYNEEPWEKVVADMIVDTVITLGISAVTSVVGGYIGGPYGMLYGAAVGLFLSISAYILTDPENKTYRENMQDLFRNELEKI